MSGVELLMPRPSTSSGPRAKSRGKPQSLARSRQTYKRQVSKAIAVVQPLDVPEMLRAMLVEGLYAAQSEGLQIHPLLLEAAERKRRELLLKEKAVEDHLETEKLKRRLLRAHLGKIKTEGRRQRSLSPLDMALLKDIYGLASQEELALITADQNRNPNNWVEEAEDYPSSSDEEAT